MSTPREAVANIFIPIAIVAFGAVAFKVITGMSASAEKTHRELPPTLVEVVDAAPRTHRVRLEATGTVQPATSIDLVAQSPGRVTEIAPGLTPGARFSKGDLIARVDSRDYRAQVDQAEANVSQARLDLALEEGRGRQASREWEMLGRGGAENPLVLRTPHLEAAKARLVSAQAGVTTAKLGLERTRLVAPFNAVVMSESLDVGQYVGPGAPVARLVGTDRFRVRVSVPVDDLMFVDIPGFGGTEEGSRARIVQRLASGGSITKEGFVLRMLGELDDATRTASLLVALDNPYDVAPGELPILPGAYVDVVIEGKELDEVVGVPRSSIVEGHIAWVADASDSLARREVLLAHADRAMAYISSGLEDGDRVVASALTLPIVGMPLEVQASVAAAE